MSLYYTGHLNALVQRHICDQLDLIDSVFQHSFFHEGLFVFRLLNVICQMMRVPQLLFESLSVQCNFCGLFKSHVINQSRFGFLSSFGQITC